MGEDNKMFDKNKRTSSSINRDDSSDYGFDSRSDLSKLCRDQPSSGNNQVTTATADYKAVSRNYTQNRNGYPAHENFNVTYKSSYVSNKEQNREHNSSFVPNNSGQASSLGMASFQSPVSPTSTQAKKHGGCISKLENNSFDSKQELYTISLHHTNNRNYRRKYENSNMPYRTSYESDEKENTELYRSIDKYNTSRPASSLGMGSFQSPVTPTTKFAKQRRGSVSDFEDDSYGSKFTSFRSYWRSKSIDISPNGFDEYQQRNTNGKAIKTDINENGKKLFKDEPSSISRNIGSKSYQTPNLIQYESPVFSTRVGRPLSRSDAFDSATRFDDTLSSTRKLPQLPRICQNYDESSEATPPKSRLRQKTLAYGVSKGDLDTAKSAAYSHGSNEDLEKVLRDLDNTGYFSEVPLSTPFETD